MNRWKAGGSVVLILALMGASFFGGTKIQKPLAATSITDSGSYPLLAKRVFVYDPNDTIINFTPLRQQLNTYFSDNQLSGGVYFEYLPTGTSVRISDDSQEVAASLIKLPVAMELYKAKELGKISLDKVIALKQEWLDSGYGDLYKQGAGYKLSLDEAGTIMLEKSDNTALQAITYSIDGLIPTDQAVFNSLDVDYHQNTDLSLSLSSKAYSSILKCLYFSCYLDQNDSEAILKKLTESDFNDRIVAGVTDKDVPVAHKIGVAGQTTQSDCGIVYLTERNYIFCALLNEPDDAASSSHIADMSKITYQFVKSAK